MGRLRRQDRRPREGRRDRDLWMVGWDGARQVAPDHQPGERDDPALEPGRALARASSSARGDETREGAPRSGCSPRRAAKPRKLTHVKGGVERLRPGRPTAGGWPSWSATPIRTTSREKTRARSPRPKPIVIDRYHFKQDHDGYLGKRRSASGVVRHRRTQAEPLTSGRFDETRAGLVPRRQPHRLRQRARTATPTGAENADLCVVDA